MMHFLLFALNRIREWFELACYRTDWNVHESNMSQDATTSLASQESCEVM